jgi:hypothetical protein
MFRGFAHDSEGILATVYGLALVSIELFLELDLGVLIWKG